MLSPQPLRRLAVAVAFAGAVTSAAFADDAPDFAGKTVTILVGYGPGGGYDTVGRLAADHLGRFLPGNPTVIVENMPGGGGLKAVAFLASSAPKDGTTLAIMPATVAFDSAFGKLPEGTKASDFTYIGRLTAPASVGITWHTTPVRTFADARLHTIKMASTGVGASSSIVPRVANARLGTRFEVVEGYQGSAEMALAMERGEVDGHVTSMETLAGAHPDWLDNGMVNIVWQLAQRRSPDYPDVPALVEFAEDEESRAIIGLVSVAGDIGRTLGAPPGVPTETVAVLRSAVDRMVQDPDFIADAERRALKVDAADGPAIEALIAEAAATPANTVAALVEIIGAAAE